VKEFPHFYASGSLFSGTGNGWRSFICWHDFPLFEVEETIFLELNLSGYENK